MKLKIAGHEIEIPRHEVHAALKVLKDPTPLTARPEKDGVTDAATGSLVIPVYTVPAGMEFRAHLLRIEGDGISPIAPFNGAGAFWQLRANERVVDEGSFVAGAPANIAFQIPFTKAYGFMAGPIAVNLETVDVRIVAGPLNTRLRAFMQGSLLPRPADAPPEK